MLRTPNAFAGAERRPFAAGVHQARVIPATRIGARGGGPARRGALRPAANDARPANVPRPRRAAPRAAAARQDGAPPPAGGPLTDAALSDLAARLAALLTPPPSGKPAAPGELEAGLDLELDAWAAQHLPIGAKRPSALLPDLLRSMGAVGGGGAAAGKGGAAPSPALLAAAAAAAATAAAASAPAVLDAEAPATPAAGGWARREAPDWDATPDSSTIHDGFWEALKATPDGGSRSASVTTQAGDDEPPALSSSDELLLAAAGGPLPAAWTSAWARRPGWAGPACLRVAPPVAALAAALLRGGPGADLLGTPADVASARAAGAAFDREVSAERALPPRAAASQLLQLHAAGVVRRVLALVASSGDAEAETGWLMEVLGCVAPRLGLLEAGIVLATVHARFGRDDLLTAATDALLPLGPARLRALLLHWALLPQLASAALPALPAPLLAEMTLSAAEEVDILGDGHVCHVPLSTVADGDAAAGAFEPSLTTPHWLGLPGVDPSALADILLSIDAAGAARNFGAATAPGPLTTVARALFRGLSPAAPAALLLAARLVSGALEHGDMRASSRGGEAAPGRARRLLQILLQAAAGGGVPGATEDVVTVGDGIAHALWRVSVAAGGAVGAGRPQQQRFIGAAATVLLALAPAELGRAAADMTVAAAADEATAELLASALVATAESADESQMLALLGSPLWPGAWEAVWAVFASPARGTFCASARGLSAALATLPTAPASNGGGRTLGAAWGGLFSARAWARVTAEAAGGAPGAAVTGPELSDVLGAVLARLPLLSAGAAHMAAAARCATPAELSRAAGGAMGELESTLYGDASAGAVSWLYASRQLADRAPGFADAPRTLRALCVAASALPADALPAFLRAAAAAVATEKRRRDDSGALRLLYACAYGARPDAELQSALLAAAPALPRSHASAALAALAPRLAPAARDAVAAAAERGEGDVSDEESVWQLGQAWPALPSSPRAAAGGNTPAAAAAATGGPSYKSALLSPAAAPAAAEWETAAELARLVARIPHAPPPGGSEDAMQDPERVAGLLRQVMAALSDPAWAPCRAEATAAAAQLGTLATKRGWGDGDLAGLLCRLPSPITLRLLAVAEAASPSLAGRRPALLAALARWHGPDGLTAQLAELYRSDRSYSLGDVCALLADARGALDAATDAAFASAATFVLGDLRGAGPRGAARHRHGYAAALVRGAPTAQSAGAADPAAAPGSRLVVSPAAAGAPSVAAGELAELMCLVHTLAAPAAARALLSAVGTSLSEPARAAVGAALPRAAFCTLGKGPELGAEVALLMGCRMEGELAPHAERAAAALRAAADTGGPGGQADRAAAALRAAAIDDISGNDEQDKGSRDNSIGQGPHSARAAAALRAAAASGGRGAQGARAAAALRAAAGGSQADQTEASLAAAAASGGAGAHAARAEAALRAAAAAVGSSSSTDPAILQLREIGAMVAADPSADPVPYLRRVLSTGTAHLLLRSLPREGRALPNAVMAPLLALALCEFDADPTEWEAALNAACTAADAFPDPTAAPAGVLSPRTRKAYTMAPAAPRAALLDRVVSGLQLLARPNREGLVSAYAAVLRAASAPRGADYEPAAALLAAMVAPPPPAPASQGLGASGAARLAALLLAGPADALPAADVLVPALGRAFTGAGDASAWFARAAANELAHLPLDRAVLGLALLRPALDAAGTLEPAALGVADAHGRAATAAALRALWAARHKAAGGDAAAAAAVGDDDVMAALALFEGAAPPPATAIVAAGSGARGRGKRGGGSAASSSSAGSKAESASLAMLGLASVAVAARVAGRVFGVGRMAGGASRLLFGHWWVLGATVSAAALISELWLASQESGDDGDSGAEEDDAPPADSNGNPFV